MLEALVAASLTVLAFGLVHSYIVPMVRLQALGSQRADLQRAASRSLNRVVTDLRGTVAAGLSLVEVQGAEVLAIHPLEGISVDGSRVFADHHVLYVHHERRLLRRTRAGASRVGPQRLEASDLQSATAPGGVVLSENTLRFEVTHAGTSGITFPLVIEMELVGPLPDQPYLARELVMGRMVGQ